MTRPRLYFPRDLQAGSRGILTKEDRKYIRSVLRLAEGDPVLLFDGSGREGEGIIDRLDDKELCVSITDAWDVFPDKMAVTLAQSLPKSDKMELILQKATELGIHGIIPFLSHRSVPRLEPGRALQKEVRWRKIVMEAARQCRRAHIPDVTPVISFREMLDRAPEAALRIILWEEESSADIKGLLKKSGRQEEKACWIVVGPEGGFTAEEIIMAKDRGFLAVSLGRHVLRTETASLAVITIIQYEMGNFFNLTGVKDT